MSSELLTELIEAGVHFGHQTQLGASPPARVHAADANILSPEEAALWETINRTLSPSELDAYNRLRLKTGEETLTDEEHGELIRLSDHAEVLHSDRMKAVLRLAALRGQEAPALAESVGL